MSMFLYGKMETPFYEFSVHIFQQIVVSLWYVSRVSFFPKALKYPNWAYVIVLKVVTPGFSTPTTSFKSIILLHDVFVVYYHINHKIVDARRHYVVGNILGYNIQLLCKDFNMLTIREMLRYISTAVSP